MTLQEDSFWEQASLQYDQSLSEALDREIPSLDHTVVKLKPTAFASGLHVAFHTGSDRALNLTFATPTRLELRSPCCQTSLALRDKRFACSRCWTRVTARPLQELQVRLEPDAETDWHNVVHEWLEMDHTVLEATFLMDELKSLLMSLCEALMLEDFLDFNGEASDVRAFAARYSGPTVLVQRRLDYLANA